MINITTANNGSSKDIPYMFGIRNYQDDFYGSSRTITAEYQVIQNNYTTNNKTTNRSEIILENCTTKHFSVIPDIEAKANESGISQWLCLPMNLIVEMGGSI